MRKTDFTYQISYMLPSTFSEDRFAILGGPYNMVLEIIEGMRSFAVELHVGSVSC